MTRCSTKTVYHNLIVDNEVTDNFVEIFFYPDESTGMCRTCAGFSHPEARLKITTRIKASLNKGLWNE